MNAVQKIIILATFCLLASGPLAATTASGNEAHQFLSFSDIHFNPFARCKVATLHPCELITKLRATPATRWEDLFEKYDNQTVDGYTHDTNYALLKASLAAIKAVHQQTAPAFTIIPGDFLAHHFREQYILYSRDRTQAGFQDFVKKTLQFLTLEIRQALPTGDIYPVVGNNDSYTGDYAVVPKGAFLRETGATWSRLIQDKANQKQLEKTFATGGYYAVNVPGHPQQRILVLNTVLFSTPAKGQAVKQAAEGQLAWLHAELVKATAAQQSVYLVFHVPMGINVYTTLKNLFHGLDEFWHPEYSAALQKDLHDFPDTVRALLPGHIHMDSFQVVDMRQPASIPVSFTPSISPIFGNNPAFKVYDYDPETFQLVNYETYYYPLDVAPAERHWQKEYNFQQIYHAKCDTCNLTQGIKQITPGNALANAFKKYYSVGTDAQPITQDHNWASYYWCDIFAVTQEAYDACLHR